MSAAQPPSEPVVAGTFVVEIDVPEDFDFGHGQLGARVSDALRGRKVAPYPLAFLTIRTSFRPADNAPLRESGAPSCP